jgi:hypothetical protein
MFNLMYVFPLINLMGINMLNSTTLVLSLSLLSCSVFASLPKWSYDAGPDPKTKMGKELIDITANIPNMPELSKKIMGRKQKFRPAFGPIPWRMLQEENKVKMLFIGQDGTHIAEAAGRPATAGFGGRAQDLAKYFGVNEGAAFINTYSFTIKGQYGIYGTPYIYTQDGAPTLRTANIVSNELWSLSMSEKSPISKWRNSLVDWIIRNNKQSMKLIVLFGGAARDGIATFAKMRGAEVLSRYENQMKNIQVPETKSEYAGGNNTFPSLVAKDGGDLYADIVGKNLDYSKSKNQKLATESLKNNLTEYIANMVFTNGGKYKNGLLNPAQLGGYDLAKMYVNGMKTISLKGLSLSDGTKIENDILVVSLPHPSYLSRLVMDAESYYEGKEIASKAVMKNVRLLDKYAEAGWEIKPDDGMVNQYSSGKNYSYGRSDIGPEFYDFGTPSNRMVSKSTARRMSGAANVVIIGTRDNGQFPKAKIKKMTDRKAAFGIDANDLFISRPKELSSRYLFDAGPGEKYAQLMVESFDFDEISKPKTGMSFEKDGIAAYNIKSHPSVGPFGHYRGTFNNPEVIIMADPIGFDDIVTARALTGERGQFIQGLMNDFGVNDNYLVFKTVPVAMDGATKAEWETVIEKTKSYRDVVMGELLKNGTPKVVIADGLFAFREANRIFKPLGITVLSMRRNKFMGTSNGIKNVAKKLNIIKSLGTADHKVHMANIPRTHLSFYARVWEGTSGDRVITSRGKKYEGIAFAEVVPSWAYNQSSNLSDENENAVLELIEELNENNLPLPYEKIPSYLLRTGSNGSISGLERLLNFFDSAA